MFKSFYGLTFNPFDKSLQENHAFQSRDYQQMLSRLDYLKNTRGIGLFTAPPGMGKTFALRCFAKNLNPNLFQLSYICLSTVSVSEFYLQFSFELGLDYSSKKTVMFRNIQERLFHLLKEKHKTFILAIDESQYLNAGIFRDIKMLMNVHFVAWIALLLSSLDNPILPLSSKNRFMNLSNNALSFTTTTRGFPPGKRKIIFIPGLKLLVAPAL
ncbi:ATP-binding protein [Candidatus Formimonas warabiya]|uniref:ATP-binding protein n=1 Tax=Formimonas warabiya TaxID=1761012 RepID=UPI001F224A07|nr:ATP-binding protein [Candidatus Formimonas warabiya]